MEETYPTKRDIQEHKDKVYQMCLLYIGGEVPIENLNAALLSLAGDATMWLYNNREHAGFNIESAKIKLLHLKVVEIP